MFLALTVLTGMVYPIVVTTLAQALFPQQAEGSLVVRQGEIVGSKLIGQPFSDPRYFWPRPSATPGVPYNSLSSAASNLGPTNRRLIQEVGLRAASWRAADPDTPSPVPADLVTASASGLDPHISVQGALYQARRVARARGLPEEVVRDLVLRHVESRALGLFGEPRVNVLLLNLQLDRLGR
ncbi:MAG: potassium-transporting ATPase subunit KdpC [Firmicutes bacterium]|nr:potassium-transporting ATPase subunit KdpC [Bacillota bacterium]